MSVQNRSGVLSLTSLSRALDGSRKNVLKISLLVLAFAFLYLPVFRAFVETWWSRDDYSHGFLIPLISLYLVWYRREKLRYIQLQPALTAGVLVMITAAAMFLLGDAGGVITLQQLSLVVMIAGLTLCFWGVECLKAVGFPLAYLLFMIPIADEVINPLHWTFQLVTAKMGVSILHLLGFTALLEGQYIFLPAITLEVAKACSGISYLISIIAIGIPLAYVTQRTVWRRLALVVSAVVIGVIANWMRVAMIGVWAYYGGAVLHGPFHLFQALFVAQIGFVALFVGAWLLSRTASPQPHLNSPGVHLGSPNIPLEERGPRDQYGPSEWSWIVAFGILLGFAANLTVMERGPVPLRTGFSVFPLSIGSWRGHVADLDNAVFRVQGADHELLRTYRSPSGDEIELYVAYFESQSHSKELVSYKTARLHKNAAVLEIPLGRENIARVNQIRLGEKRGESRALFWYDLNGRIVADRYQAKLLTTMDALLHRRTNGAFVLISSNEDLSWTAERTFIQNLIPVFHRYFPWSDKQ